MTRKEYLDVRGDRAAQAAAHRQYYAQFVSTATIGAVVAFIGREKLLASTDPHLNDIPLSLWDRLTNLLPLAVRFRDLGDYPTLAGFVCVAKEAARQYIEGQQARTPG